MQPQNTSANGLLEQRERMAREHAAWQDIMAELRKLGLEPNDATADELARALRKWGEELHQLRLGDPRYDARALADVRACYEGQYERGTYPETSR
jgi:hypothetical protein